MRRRARRAASVCGPCAARRDAASPNKWQMWPARMCILETMAADARACTAPQVVTTALRHGAFLYGTQVAMMAAQTGRLAENGFGAMRARVHVLARHLGWAPARKAEASVAGARPHVFVFLRRRSAWSCGRRCFPRAYVCVLLPGFVPRPYDSGTTDKPLLHDRWGRGGWLGEIRDTPKISTWTIVYERVDCATVLPVGIVPAVAQHLRWTCMPVW